MKMKRLISFAICILIVLTSVIPQVFAAKSNEDYIITDEMQLMSRLGIMDITKPDYELTKGDLAVIIAKLLLDNNIKSASSNNYIDVTSELTSADAINSLYDMGIINKDTRYFNPLINATPDDLVGMFVGGVLGYYAVTDDAMAIAGSIGALKGIDFSQKKLQASKVAEFLFRNLDTPFLVGYNGVYKTDAQTTLMYFLKIERIYGKLVSSPDGFAGARSYNENQIIVESGFVDYRIKLDDFDVNGYLGASGEFYYTSDSDHTLIYAFFPDVKFTKVYGSDITSVTNDKIIYSEAKTGKSKTIDYLSAVIVYNGTSIASSNMPLYLQPDLGYMEVLTENNKTVSVYVWDFEVGITDGTDAYDGRILFKDAVYKPQTLNYGEISDVKVYINETLSSPEKIARGQVIWYAKNKEGTKLNIFTSSDNVFWGKYEEMGNGTVTISGESYPYNANLFDSSVYPPLNIGETAMFYKSPVGEIFYYVPDKYIENNMYGYAMMVSSPATGIDTKVMIRIVNELGQIKDYPLSKKISYYDGTVGGSYTTISCESFRDLPEFFSGGVFIDQLIRYTFNAQGEIIKIARYQDLTQITHPDFAMGFSQNNFTKVLSGNNSIRYDRNGSGKFDNRYLASPSCIVFIIKPDLSEGIVSLCSESLSKKFYDNTVNTGELSVYNADMFMTVSMAVLKTSQKFNQSSSNYFILDSITKGLNADGNECMFINGYQGYDYIKHPVSEMCTIPADLKRGDIISIGIYNNEISYIERRCGADSAHLYKSIFTSGSSSDTPENSHASKFIFRGKMYGVSNAGDSVVIKADVPGDFYRGFALALSNVFIYDSTRDKLYPLSLAELPAASYDEPLEIGMFAESSKIKSVVVYK